MSTHGSRVDLEEIEVTRTEKLLAVVLTVFFLIGGVWAYAKLDDIGRSEYRPARRTSRPPSGRRSPVQARRSVSSSGPTATEQQARQDLELAREAYRTALDAGTKAPGLQASYRAAQRDFAAAQAEVARTRGEVAEAQPAADAAYNRADEEARQDSRQSEIVTFLLRLALLLGTLGSAYWLLIRLRRSGSRYLPVAFALVAFGALLALVMAGDYVAHHIDVAQLGPLVLSLAGIAFTLVAFWWLQGYLARRIPQRRVRKGECPFCGYPTHGGEHCEGCGRAVIGECTTCHEPRRVGAFHCGACGAS